MPAHTFLADPTATRPSDPNRGHQLSAPASQPQPATRAADVDPVDDIDAYADRLDAAGWNDDDQHELPDNPEPGLDVNPEDGIPDGDDPVLTFERPTPRASLTADEAREALTEYLHELAAVGHTTVTPAQLVGIRQQIGRSACHSRATSRSATGGFDGARDQPTLSWETGRLDASAGPE